MKVKLSIMNRMSLLGLLTNEGDLTVLKVLRELREELSFTQDEHAVLQLKSLPEGKVAFDEKAISDKEFEFEGIREILVEKVKTKLRTMEEKGKLLLDYLSLYEVLIEKPGLLKLVKEEVVKEDEPIEDLGLEEDEEEIARDE